MIFMKNSKNKECTFKYLLCFVITSFANQEGICKPNKIIFQLPFVLEVGICLRIYLYNHL